MKSKALMAGFRAYVKKTTVKFTGDEEGVALVYAQDQFKLDFKRGTVKLVGVYGLLEVPALKGWNNGPIDWIGDLVQYERHQLVFGRGDPWGEEGIRLLPSTQGVIRAVPLLVALGAD